MPNLAVGTTVIRRAASKISPNLQKYGAVYGDVAKSYGLFPPHECLPYWQNIFGWGTEDNYKLDNDRFTEQDLAEKVKVNIYNDLTKRLFISGKQRLLFKQPGFSLKPRFFNALFPRAIFLHCVRHPIENWRSLVHVKRQSDEKVWGTKIPDWRDLIAVSAPVQAALQLQVVAQFIEHDLEQIENIKKRYLQVRYERIIREPEQTLHDI